MKKILVPTLRFPPAGGVGLRRIIKMGKNMAADGIEVHYLTTSNDAHINSYTEDIKKENIIVKKIISLSLNNYLNRPRSGLLGKIFAKLVYFITLPIFFIDYATLWGLALIPYAFFYIKKHDIKNIYVSGPPFSTLLHMTLLKRFFLNDVNLICEWRDVWTEDYERIYVPPRVLSRWIQIQMEKVVIRKANYVIGVTNSIIKNLMKNDSDKDKFLLIENGFDLDSFSIENDNGCKNQNGDHKTIICYAGNIVDTRAEGFFLFLDAIMDYPGNDIVFEMCGSLGYMVKNKLQKHYSTLLEKGLFKYHGVLSTKDAISLIQQSDVGLVVVQRQQPEALTSKFFEYCAAKKPIIAIGPCGDLQKKMRENRVGIYCELDNFSSDELYSFLHMNFDKKEFCFDKILRENDFSYLAKKVEMILE